MDIFDSLLIHSGNFSRLDSTVPLPEYGLAVARLGAAETLTSARPVQADFLSPMVALTSQLFHMLLRLMDPARATGAVGQLPVDGGAQGLRSEGARSNETPPPDAMVNRGNNGDQGAASGNMGSWGQQDQQFLDKAIGSSTIQGDSAQYDKLFSNFGQGKEGNCASVAVIKAALDKYDGKVFQSVKKSGDGYSIQMQDGKSISISRGELQEAAKASKFKGQPNQVKSMAVLMFAAIAKRGSQEVGGSFSSTLRNLDNGFSSKKAAKLLGLGNRIREVDPATAGQKDSVVGYSSRHAVYIDSGKTDHYGRATGYNSTDTNGRRLNGAFTFV